MKAALVDNGSLEPAAHKALRMAAADVARRSGVDLDAVSWKHSDRIAARDLDGRPARTLVRWIRAHLAEGEREFVLVPFVVCPDGAIGSAIRAEAEEAGRGVAGFRVSFATGLAAGDVLPGIVTARVREALTSRRVRRHPTVVVVDHGGPSPAAGRLRDAVACEVRRRLGAEAKAVVAASMEAPGGCPEFPFSRPLLEEVLDRPELGEGDAVIALLFLSPGRHAGPDGDLARIAQAAEARHPRLRCHFTALAGDHPAAIEALAEGLRAALPIPVFS